MHSIKGSWVGQTFALAKCNESDGRKTRIRRSKEERKAMVQDFIKKHQKSNNGSFPSLNLTHKEVGGSFYTVREIVRDLIQENRVLGPGKLTLEEQGINQILKQDTFDSDASDPQSFLTISSISDLRVSNGVPLPHEPTINGSQVDVMENDSDELVHVESVVNGSIEAEEHSEELLSSMVNDHIIENEKNYEESVIMTATDLTVEKERNGEQESKATKTTENPVGSDVVVETETNSEHNLKVTMARITPIVSDVVVETFPLRVITRTTDISGQDSDEVLKMKGSSEDLGIEESRENDQVSETKITSAKSSDSMDCQTTTTLGNPSLGMTSDLVGGETGKNNGVQDNVVDHDILPSKSFVQGQATDEAKVVNGLTNDGNEAKGNNLHSNELERESNPTLDRINLESWEGNSKSRAKEEKNPVLALFKAFLSAFGHLWSDFSRL